MSELISEVRNILNDLRGTLNQYRSQIEKLLQGNISVKVNLKTTQKIVIALFLALLFGIILALIYNRRGCPSPLGIFILVVVATFIIYWLL